MPCVFTPTAMLRSAGLTAALALVATACGGSTAPAAPSEPQAPVTAASDAGAPRGTSTEPPIAQPTTAPPTTRSPTTQPSTPPAPATTADPPSGVTPSDLAGAGPHVVGVATVAFPGGDPEQPQLIEVWYPADGPGDSTDTYAVRSFLPEAVASLIPADTDDGFTTPAGRGLPPDASGAPFPLVLFSHGSSAYRSQSSDLAAHLASWGMVVASTDHPQRSLEFSLVGGPPEPTPTAVEDVRALRTLLTSDPEDIDSGDADTAFVDSALVDIGAIIDPTRVGLAGHSAGGGTILSVAVDDGIAGYVSYASGARDDTPLPNVPSLFMAGTTDAIVTPDRTLAAFEQAPAPAWYWEFADAGHLVFSDLCAIGGDATLIDLAESAGIGDLVPDGLRRLATDGCEEPNRPVQRVWPAIKQGTTGFFRLVFGIDREPVGLSGDGIEGLSTRSR